MSKSLFLQLNITLVQNNWRINYFFSSENMKKFIIYFSEALNFFKYSLKNYPVGSNFNRDIKLDKIHRNLLLKIK